jgi:fumarylacetoacetase
MTISTANELWGWKSWVESANDPDIGFPLQSLPYCSFVSSVDGVDSERPTHLGVGIGTFILDLHDLGQSGLLASLSPSIQAACAASQLNPLMRCGRDAWSALRRALMNLLRDDASPAQKQAVTHLLVPIENISFVKPVAIENYTDFYASIDHAISVGKLFRPDQPLLPNYKWIPIGYHGRASSLVISGTAIRRPHGQIKSPTQDSPIFATTTQLDYELEIAAYVCIGNPLGTQVSIVAAEDHIFGFSLLNDWSARDIQAWEYQPLGPFLGKSFATSVSPWIVPIEALQPFRVPPYERPPGDPHPLSYLADSSHAKTGGVDMTLEVFLSTARMRADLLPPVRLSTGNLRDLYWTFAQMIAHHTSNGCNLVEGDLLASGTVSGPRKDSQGSLLEITRRGASPLHLANGEVRSFLEDGDEVIFKGFCEKIGFPRISLGECRGTIVPGSQAS